jgi:hypothetical protein
MTRQAINLGSLTHLLHLKDNLPRFRQVEEVCFWGVGLGLASCHRDVATVMIATFATASVEEEFPESCL